MTDIKSIQRLLVVQTVYEQTLNKNREDIKVEELFFTTIALGYLITKSPTSLLGIVWFSTMTLSSLFMSFPSAILTCLIRYISSEHLCEQFFGIL